MGIKKGTLIYVDISHMTGIVIPSANKSIAKKFLLYEKRFLKEAGGYDGHETEYEWMVQYFIDKHNGIELERVTSIDTPRIIKYDSERRVQVN